jgi:hypothetical protein
MGLQIVVGLLVTLATGLTLGGLGYHKLAKLRRSYEARFPS